MEFIEDEFRGRFEKFEPLNNAKIGLRLIQEAGQWDPHVEWLKKKCDFMSKDLVTNQVFAVNKSIMEFFNKVPADDEAQKTNNMRCAGWL